MPESTSPDNPDHSSGDPARPHMQGDVVDAPGQAGPDSPSPTPTIDIQALAQTARRLSWWAGLVSIVLLCLVVYLPGFFTLPPVDRDESRFAQASRQMLQSGEWVVPMIQDRPRLNKPPLIYWLQASSVMLFTAGRSLFDAIWMYRVPSLVAGIAAVLLTRSLAAAMFEARTARLAAVLLAVCPVMLWEVRQARADMVLVACTLGAQLALWNLWRAPREPGARRGWRWPLVFWLSLGVGILVKGPITPMICSLTALTASILTRRWHWWRNLRPLAGIVILALLVAPWVIAVIGRIGWDQYSSTIWNETIGRSTGAKDGHWAPPGYHLLLLAVLFWPGSLLTAFGVVLAWKSLAAYRSASGTPVRAQSASSAAESAALASAFCLGWIAPSWVIFELVATKLPHYTMPLLPAIAILSARAVLAVDAGLVPFAKDRLARVGHMAWLAIGVVVAVLLPIAIVVRASKDLGWLVGIVALILALLTVNYLRISAAALKDSKRVARAQIAGVGAAILAAWCLLGLLLPRLDSLWISPRLAQALAQIDPGRTRPVAAIGYHEDSLIFALRGGVERLDEQSLEAWLAAHPGGLVLIPQDRLTEQRALVPLAAIAGFNYSKGKSQTLALAERAR